MNRHHEFSAPIAATAAATFAYLDDPRRLGAHMGQSSAMMAGAKMQYRFDAGNGRTVGSRIRLTGKMLGLTLCVEEIVSRHEAPIAKTWKTIGRPRLLVIGAYEMGFRLRPGISDTTLTVFIDYALPSGPWWLVGWLLAGVYARWCVRSMVNDAACHFGAVGT